LGSLYDNSNRWRFRFFSLVSIIPMTRLEQLVCAVLQSGVIQPHSQKLMLRLGFRIQPQTLEEMDQLAAIHDLEVAERAMSIALMIQTKIADIELLEQDIPVCHHKWPENDLTMWSEGANPQCENCGMRYKTAMALVGKMGRQQE
jgi:hypothetical protein